MASEESCPEPSSPVATQALAPVKPFEEDAVDDSEVTIIRAMNINQLRVKATSVGVSPREWRKMVPKPELLQRVLKAVEEKCRGAQKKRRFRHP